MDRLGTSRGESSSNATDVDFGHFIEETSAEGVIVVDESPSQTQLSKKMPHVCDVCKKTFVSYKGLQQHAVVHTNKKPFICDICNKAFRFKSNLFEHRSLHNQTVLHACPYCGKTCRLKGNLKKHLKTHVTSKEELDQAWIPFSRRSSNGAYNDVVIEEIDNSINHSVLIAPTPCKLRKRRHGLGTSSKVWTDKIRHGEVMPLIPIEEKMNRLLDMIHEVEEGLRPTEDLIANSRFIAFERFDCPECRFGFMSRMECLDHIETDHPNTRKQRQLFCEICLRSFNDKKSMQQHEYYHEQVRTMVDKGELTIADPDIVLPEENGTIASKEVNT